MNPEVLRASGYVYRNASRTLEQFQTFFNFNPLKYPKYFYVTRTDLVVATPALSIDYETYAAPRRAMMGMLTGRITVPAMLVEGQEDNRG
jgi:hypothetical protein